jgi:FHS family L-fucose permease-like MFS transporter
MGAFALSDMRKTLKHVLVVLVPVTALIVIRILPQIGVALHQDWPRVSELCSPQNAMHYGILLAVLLVAFFAGESSANRMLAIFSGLIIILLITGMMTAGDVAKWAILGVGLFCSVMWSNIFSLAIEGLGPMKSQASSLLVLAILGGALLPPTQGAVADNFGLQYSYVVPVIAFAYIAFYGLYGYRAGRQVPAPAAVAAPA